MKKTLSDLRSKKQLKQKISMLTCYDYPTARLQDQADMDVIFVGDSLGPNELGYEHEKDVTLEDMIHHLKAVRRGIKNAYLLADMPYGTYDTIEAARTTAMKLIDHGADGVKLEGLELAVIEDLSKRGIETWAHLGFNPQKHIEASVHGKTFETARSLVEAADALQSAGACMMVLELVPEEVGALLTERLLIPTIGIGAGRFTDGQVLIAHDLLGLTPKKLRHAKDYGQLDQHMLTAFQHYVKDVSSGMFPEKSNLRHMDQDELHLLRCYLLK
ncbi:3-methyl-2-oxobutanoate hydroxymethyltransferase [Paenibacillus agaridevorans]|uniref:3-methyl-2-oxobutanoate hydroxymethyltransferase n=1 Tax=Paenibacillus agaridevorans TaxID=171404 RepID=A0A2R5EIK3_9BACL|nr:3-methyl-2-oxobutanoate hydroxymethyltransferase [Paenibacillus agaridevorans]GBG06436.1 3-methyl-2-oxobutanoate hydroxymethyltransferase [Paenibacillus agaridevorans]